MKRLIGNIIRDLNSLIRNIIKLKSLLKANYNRNINKKVISNIREVKKIIKNIDISQYDY